MEMTKEQLELITNQLATIKERSPFYAKKFEGIDVTDVRTQADFEKLPFSEKDDLRAVYPLGLQAVPDEEVVRIHSSSGTTGTPVIIPYTQQDVIDWAMQFARCYEMAGITTARPHPNHPGLRPVDGRHRLSVGRRAPGRHGHSHGAGQHRKAAEDDAGSEVHGASAPPAPTRCCSPRRSPSATCATRFI